jgi:hypothetical protein
MSAIALADAILVVHVLFVSIVILLVPLVITGGIRGWHWVRMPWVRLGHLAMIAFVAGEALIGMQCPLTTWENNLRVAGSDRGYNADGFIATWLDRLMFWHFPHWVFTTAYVGYGLIVASLFYFVPVRFTGKPSDITP